MKKRIFITAAIISLTAPLCFAQSLPEDVDLDKDGCISREEAKNVAGLEEQFQVLDVNHDGKIDKAELSLFVKK